MTNKRYELLFPEGPGEGTGEGSDTAGDTVEVSDTGQKGPGGHPVYADATGIVRAEISDRGEVRMLPSGGGQQPVQGVRARPLPDA
ncbi:hypothetical protein DEJ50_01510 [Streptomyces venezuelae]|uniref:Uncharacterized protein n=1 Tax=Streptomyces venezuelae TaxID=54571 RepID=A0A5P2CY75_STRVZ|nr:DUF6296 family protein [Streptomyces venezuelae]QES46728.1 hypothetical protein DEJ50_01510 [Streptomyces venezuelae]